MNRRKFFINLSKLGMSGLIIDQLFDSIILGQIQKLLAKDSSNRKFYLGVYSNGGPARWMFDLPLCDNQSEVGQLIKNPFCFTGWPTNQTQNNNFDGQLDGSYVLKEVGSNGLWLPPLWESSFGGNSLTDLSKHCYFIRGLNNLAIHTAWQKQFIPRSDRPSMHAICIQTGSPLTFPCVQYGVNLPMGLKSGAVPMIGRGREINGIVNSVLGGISLDSSENPLSDSDLSEKMDLALDKLKAIGRKHNFTSNTLHTYRIEAKKALIKGIESVTVNFDDIYTGYLDTFVSAMKNEITHLDDKPIYPTNNYFSNVDAPIPRGDNFTLKGKAYGLGWDLRKSFIDENKNVQASLNGFAAGLALTEILFKGNEGDYTAPYSSSVLLSSGEMGIKSARNKMTNLTNDSHAIGAVPTILLFTKYWQGVAHMLNAFRINNGPIFGDTVIHLASEFSRSPRYDGSGSDHGGVAGVSTLISGKIKQGRVYGDVRGPDADTAGNYKGSWGQNKNGWSSANVYGKIEELMEIPLIDRFYKHEGDEIE